MPFYDYKREDGTVFEVLQGINEDPLEVCPTTGQKVTRIISGGNVGFQYKAKGFYHTDYKGREMNVPKMYERPTDNSKL